MRIVRDYFGLDRTTVTYDCDISGVGGDADSFYIVADVVNSDGRTAARTVVTLSHEEMVRMLADYRHNCPLDAEAPPTLLSGPRRRRRGLGETWHGIVRLFHFAVSVLVRGKRVTLSTLAASRPRRS